MVGVARMSRALGVRLRLCYVLCEVRACKQPQNTQYLRIRNIEHVLTRSACYIMVCTDVNSHTNDQETQVCVGTC